MTTYKRRIKWKPTPLKPQILQIYSRGIEYALVSDCYEQCHNFVWCKDFLHDVLHASINERAIEIYRFKFNLKNPQPCQSKIRLLLANSKDKKFASKIPACLDFINQIEERIKIKKTQVRECSSPPENYKNGIFIFEGSRRWIQAPPMLSLYSLLLRVGFSHTLGDSFTTTIEGIKSGKIKPYQKHDRRWLDKIGPALEKIFRLGDRRIFHKNIKANYPKKFAIDEVHNKLGIIGFSSDMLYHALGQSVVVPSWHILP